VKPKSVFSTLTPARRGERGTTRPPVITQRKVNTIKTRRPGEKGKKSKREEKAFPFFKKKLHPPRKWGKEKTRGHRVRTKHGTAKASPWGERGVVSADSWQKGECVPNPHDWWTDRAPKKKSRVWRNNEV